MSRDYKNNAARKQRKPASKPAGGFPAVLPFLSGLSIGLFIAFVIYLRGYSLDNPPFSNSGEKTAAADEQRTSGSSESSPKFDFYTILQEREVKVPEWHLEEPDTQPAAAEKPAAKEPYLLQVGSFQQHAEADRARARLALLGIDADIQRVVINGQDIWYRVRVGPISDPARLNELRRRLQKNGMTAMVLKMRG